MVALFLHGPTAAHRRYGAWWLARTRVAWEMLVNHNLRLVVAMVRKMLNGRASIGALAYLDLVQLGNAGLMKAAWRFDYRRGHRFTTMATWWVRQSLSRGIDDGAHVIRRPVHVTTALRKGRRLLAEWQTEPGRAASAPPDKWLIARGMTAAQVRVWRDGPPPDVTSLDAELEPHGPSFRDGETNSLADMLEGPPPAGGTDDVEARLAASELVARLRDILTDRQLVVLLLRSGAVGERLSLEEIGRRIGTTRERVRQIEDGARRKLLRRGLQLDGSVGARRTTEETERLMRSAKPSKPAAATRKAKAGQ
jgi:RNA polymerase primary sigma factor